MHRVDIAAPGDASEPAGGAAGVFARGQAQGAGEMSPGREPVEVADVGAERVGGDQPDAAGPLQVLAAQVARGEVLHGGLDPGRAGFKGFDLRQHGDQGMAQRHGQVVVTVFQRRLGGRRA